jgi:hypothetical protein
LASGFAIAGESICSEAILLKKQLFD